MLFSTMSCKKDMFNAETYKEILKLEFPIDPIDEEHQWNLTARRSATITVPASAKDALRLMVLTDHPANNKSAAIMAETSDFNVGNNVFETIGMFRFLECLSNTVIAIPVNGAAILTEEPCMIVICIRQKILR